jgi:uncharacterized membrane-anchored protein YhcB (DUF1043 family)
MLVAWLLAIVLGAAIGYLVSQRGSRRYWQQQLEQQQLTLQTELEAVKRELQQQRQENADLRYRLGESEKARRYMESRQAGDDGGVE